MESEPPYQYVRGNPVNWVDPSGLLKNYIIARELGFNNFAEVIKAFTLDGDWGLLRALQDATNGDKIYTYANLGCSSSSGLRD